ncbi:MAG: methyltransferase domain-containing protein [Anaerolineales bacterium]
MSLTSEEWHQRFLQQAQWTKGFRAYIFPRIGFSRADRILDIGCGTGALMEEWNPRERQALVGGDLNEAFLNLAMRNYPGGTFFCGDAHHLPFPAETFEISFNHYLLLWVEDPVQVVEEMKRVTKSGGVVLALAEPDYGGRIDYPPPLDTIQDRQIASLDAQGADPKRGRKLRRIFHEAGVKEIKTGVFEGQWAAPPDQRDWEMEWKILENDLKELISPEMLNALKEADLDAWRKGHRTLFLPTFYAWGKV